MLRYNYIAMPVVLWCGMLLAVGWKRVIIRVNTGRWWLVLREREGDISAGCDQSHLLLYKV